MVGQKPNPAQPQMRLSKEKVVAIPRIAYKYAILLKNTRYTFKEHFNFQQMLKCIQTPNWIGNLGEKRQIICIGTNQDNVIRLFGA